MQEKIEDCTKVSFDKEHSQYLVEIDTSSLHRDKFEPSYTSRRNAEIVEEIRRELKDLLKAKL